MLPYHKGELLQWHIANIHHFTKKKLSKCGDMRKRYISITITREKYTGYHVAVTHIGEDSPKTWDELLKKVTAMRETWRYGGSKN